MADATARALPPLPRAAAAAVAPLARFVAAVRKSLLGSTEESLDGTVLLSVVVALTCGHVASHLAWSDLGGVNYLQIACISCPTVMAFTMQMVLHHRLAQRCGPCATLPALLRRIRASAERRRRAALIQSLRLLPGDASREDILHAAAACLQRLAPAAVGVSLVATPCYPPSPPAPPAFCTCVAAVGAGNEEHQRRMQELYRATIAADMAPSAVAMRPGAGTGAANQPIRDGLATGASEGPTPAAAGPPSDGEGASACIPGRGDDVAADGAATSLAYLLQRPASRQPAQEAALRCVCSADSPLGLHRFQDWTAEGAHRPTALLRPLADALWAARVPGQTRAPSCLSLAWQPA